MVKCPVTSRILASFLFNLHLLLMVDGSEIRRSPVDMVNIPLFTGFCTSRVVVWDFFHQQYFGAKKAYLKRGTFRCFPKPSSGKLHKFVLSEFGEPTQHCVFVGLTKTLVGGFSPAHLKHMRTSKWVHLPQGSG